MNSSTASNSSSYSLASPLPSPVSPSSLTVETPSLGDALLPRPKRGAPARCTRIEAEGTEEEGQERTARPGPLRGVVGQFRTAHPPLSHSPPTPIHSPTYPFILCFSTIIPYHRNPLGHAHHPSPTFRHLRFELLDHPATFRRAGDETKGVLYSTPQNLLVVTVHAPGFSVVEECLCLSPSFSLSSLECIFIQAGQKH
ncbi:hypothetical protein MSAN_00081500 [Mycena sanguinolenta]|uniref:Uncharacterized protein n=1 Tax=Mycena sanguinolenta TaxID=230812 RepID=A0A8H7DKE4_9AGAR|nr:hypothetical protein MSAN_00081500 [Mycena sanguinolenta]